MRLWIGQVIVVALGVGYLAMGPVESAVAPASVGMPAYLTWELPAPPPVAPFSIAGRVAAVQTPQGYVNPTTVKCVGPYCRNVGYPFCTGCGRCGRAWIDYPHVWVWLPYAAVRQRCWTSCCGYSNGQLGCQTYTWTEFGPAGCC